MPVQRYWREIPQRYRLEAAKCNKCGQIYFPPRLICEKCKSREFNKVRLPEEGEIFTYTIIHVAPSQFTKQVPYAFGIIKLDNGVKISAQIVDCNPSELKIGQRVKIEFRKIQEEGSSGIICYGYKGVPV